MRSLPEDALTCAAACLRALLEGPLGPVLPAMMLPAGVEGQELSGEVAGVMSTDVLFAFMLRVSSSKGQLKQIVTDLEVRNALGKSPSTGDLDAFKMVEIGVDVVRSSILTSGPFGRGLSADFSSSSTCCSK